MESPPSVAARALVREGVGTVVVPPPVLPSTKPPPALAAAQAAMPGVDLVERLRRNVAAWFHRREVGPAALAALSLALAAAGGFVLLAGHQGFGASLGLLALGAGALATAPPPWATRQGSAFADGLAPLADLLLMAGFFGGLAHHHPPIVVVVAFLVLALMAWMPLAGPSGSGLWRRGERMMVLVLGALLGRPAPALLALLVVCTLDAWLRVVRLEPFPSRVVVTPPSWVRRMLLPDGTLQPVVRWSSLALVVLGLFLLPQSDLWRF